MSSSEGSEGSTSTDEITHSQIRTCAPSIVITEDLMCSYCEGHLKTGRVGKKLGCGHIFHPACILRCLARNRRCPTCGSDLIETAPQDRSDDPNILQGSNVANAEEEFDDEAHGGPVSIFLRRLENTEISEVMLCAICRRNLKPGDVGKKLNCGHIFHCHCIGNNYKKLHERCPLCRREI